MNKKGFTLIELMAVIIILGVLMIIAVPSVTGRTEQEAKEELTNQGFEVDIAYEEDKSKTNGTVLKQSLEVGKTVDEGSKITLTVNKIAEEKRAKIYVNVKSITGGYTEPVTTTTNNENDVDNTNSTSQSVKTEKEIDRTANIKVTVNDEKIYDAEVYKNITDLRVGEAVGTGTVTIKLFVDDIRKEVKSIDLNEISTYTFD